LLAKSLHETSYGKIALFQFDLQRNCQKKVYTRVKENLFKLAINLQCSKNVPLFDGNGDDSDLILEGNVRKKVYTRIMMDSLPRLALNLYV
jgi:hypothetical protein